MGPWKRSVDVFGNGASRKNKVDGGRESKCGLKRRRISRADSLKKETRCKAYAGDIVCELGRSAAVTCVPLRDVVSSDTENSRRKDQLQKADEPDIVIGAKRVSAFQIENVVSTFDFNSLWSYIIGYILRLAKTRRESPGIYTISCRLEQSLRQTTGLGNTPTEVSTHAVASFEP